MLNKAQLIALRMIHSETPTRISVNWHTPVQKLGGRDIWVKRDDLFKIAGVAGGKARTCWYIATTGGQAEGLITAGSRSSPQVNIVAHIALALGMKCRVHTPSGKPGGEVAAAVDAGAVRIEHSPGYNTVIVARAREDAESLPDWRLIPFGMECQEAIDQTAGQVVNLPREARRLVVPVGSGMSLAGILHGLHRSGIQMPVLGVCVGADPSKRLDRWAPPSWRRDCELVQSALGYDQPPKETEIEGLRLDSIYEAKCLPFLEPDDCLWVVGVRQSDSKGEHHGTNNS